MWPGIKNPIKRADFIDGPLQRLTERQNKVRPKVIQVQMAIVAPTAPLIQKRELPLQKKKKKTSNVQFNALSKVSQLTEQIAADEYKEL